MTLRLEGLLDLPPQADDWPLRGRPPFMESTVFRQLKTDITAYADGEISGRSYLIAGHRGAGKTSLAIRAVQDLRYDRLTASMNQEMSRTTRANRPLLVKIHGPSLLEPVSVPGAPAKTGPDQNASAAAKTGTDKEKTGTDQDKSAIAEPPPPSPAHATLVQLVIGLYRALVDEVREGYVIKARAGKGPTNTPGEEVGAQLALDLDSGPEPATLRSYWDKIGRLSFGVLWPARTDLRLTRANLTDQGLREILAISIAAQAFQVCTGTLTQKRTEVASLTRESEVKAVGTTDLKEALGRVGAMAAGGLTGAALWQQSGGPEALGAGLVVWALGTASLSWSFSNRRKRDRTTDYTFLRDTSVQTLDRDLPVVIRRVREAGMAPIFVVDELDKLPNPQETLTQIIGRLKHIVADFGFFCFLTDRRYFDEVEEDLQKSAFPIQHTYFNERELIVYTPEDFLEYLQKRLVADTGAAPDDLSQPLIALNAICRSQLNFAELVRQLSDLDSSGVLRMRWEDLVKRQDLFLGAAVQLAINLVLTDPILKVRMEQDQGFAQLVFDTLYAVPRDWAADKPDYKTDPQELKTYLEDRVNAGRDEKENRKPWALPPGDLKVLQEARSELIRLLASFPTLAREVGASPRPDRSRLAGLVPASVVDAAGVVLRDGLIKLSEDGSCLEFTYDRFGQPLVGNDAAVIKEDAQQLVALIDGFIRFLNNLKVELADLTRAQLLPPTLNIQSLTNARRHLAGFVAGSTAERMARPEVPIARGLQQALDLLGPRLGAGLVLGFRIGLDAPGKAPLKGALGALSAYPIFDAAGGGDWTLEDWLATHPLFAALGPAVSAMPPLSSAPESLTRFWSELSKLVAWSMDPPADLTRSVPLQPESWPTRFERFFAGLPANPAGIGYEDLRDAALGRSPAALLRADLQSMQTSDWSRFCLAMLPQSGDPSQTRWALVAALRALRFAPDILAKVAAAADLDGPRPSLEDQQPALHMAAGAQGGQTGLLIIVNEDLDGAGANLTIRDGMLFVSSSDLKRFAVGLDWLQQLSAFEGWVDEY